MSESGSVHYGLEVMFLTGVAIFVLTWLLGWTGQRGHALRVFVPLICGVAAGLWYPSEDVGQKGGENGGD